MSEPGPSTTLGAGLLRLLPPPARLKMAQVADLDQQLAALWEKGAKAWPSVSSTPEAFVEALAAILSSPERRLENLGELDAGEVYLCGACVGHDPAALRAFEQRYMGQVRERIAKVVASDRIDDVKQAMWERLFASCEGGAPRILLYAGKGELDGLVRTVAYRTAISLVRKESHGESEQDLGLEIPAALNSPELGMIREQYRTTFRAAFAAAVGDMSARQRTVLRLRFVDGLSVGQICALYGVHRVTGSRWLSDGRSDLAKAIHRHLAASLRMDPEQLSSFMTLIDSQLTLSLDRLLNTDDAPSPNDGQRGCEASKASLRSK